MKQPIIAFSEDVDSQWVAHMECGHRRHVRHDPPLHDRPWTQRAETRNEQLGKPMHCVRCAESEPPDDVVEYKRTPTFTESTVPAALLRDHATRAGVWGQIVAESGALRVGFHPDRSLVLEAGQHAWCAPTQTHAVEPLGAVRFHVRFCRPQG